MYHTIEFTVEFTADLEVSAKQPLERLLLERGTRRRAQIKPYVVESRVGLVEVADLFFEDGTALRTVPFASFFFVDEPHGPPRAP
jgi:hypothetical protein